MTHFMTWSLSELIFHWLAFVELVTQQWKIYFWMMSPRLLRVIHGWGSSDGGPWSQGLSPSLESARKKKPRAGQPSGRETSAPRQLLGGSPRAEMSRGWTGDEKWGQLVVPRPQARAGHPGRRADRARGVTGPRAARSKGCQGFRSPPGPGDPGRFHGFPFRGGPGHQAQKPGGNAQRTTSGSNDPPCFWMRAVSDFDGRGGRKDAGTWRDWQTFGRKTPHVQELKWLEEAEPWGGRTGSTWPRSRQWRGRLRSRALATARHCAGSFTSTGHPFTSNMDWLGGPPLGPTLEMRKPRSGGHYPWEIECEPRSYFTTIQQPHSQT